MRVLGDLANTLPGENRKGLPPVLKAGEWRARQMATLATRGDATIILP